jgi:hypothetical protein
MNQKMTLEKTSSGFVLFLVVIVLGAIAALYFMKDAKGNRYIDNMLHKKEEVMKEVGEYKQNMEARDKEILQNL